MAEAISLSNTDSSAANTSGSLSEVLHLTQQSVETLRTFLSQLDDMVGNDFQEIMDKISETRSDMHLLSTEDNGISPIPEAGHELKEVVKATEDATDRIMEAAETIMTADHSDHALYHKTVESNLMEIFEACSFQDITGQRINRVVDTLEFVDYRIHKIATFLGFENEDDSADKTANNIKAKQARKEDLILHGPQTEGKGVCQSEIDDLF